MSNDEKSAIEASCPRWIQFLDETIGNPKAIRELQKFFGYCLTSETTYEKMLVLFGPGANGKSVLLRVLESVVGARYVTRISLDRLSRMECIAELDGKALNISTGSEWKALSKQEIKAIVSGDPLAARHKGCNDIFEFSPKCKIAYATSYIPKNDNKDEGLWRRFLIIGMTRRFVGDDADPLLVDGLLSELIGIGRWASQGFLMLQEDDGFREINAEDGV